MHTLSGVFLEEGRVVNRTTLLHAAGVVPAHTQMYHIKQRGAESEECRTRAERAEERQEERRESRQGLCLCVRKRERDREMALCKPSKDRLERRHRESHEAARLQQREAER